MKQLTNKEKYELISKALKSIETDKTIFICTTLEGILGVNVNEMFKIIPELLEYKPIDKKPKFTWWLNDEQGKNERIRVLKELQKRFLNEKEIIKIA